MATDSSDRLERAASRATGPRRSRRDHKGDVEGQVLEAAERLLAETPLHELHVSDIIKEAGISRATFYYYFASKFAVLAALLARTSDEMVQAVQPWVGGPSDADPLDRLQQSLRAAAGVWRAHGAVTRSVSEHWTVEPDLGELWLAVIERFTDAFVELASSDASVDAPRDGAALRPLVASLVWATERCFYVASAGVDDRLPDLDVAVDAVFEIWASALYGSDALARWSASARTAAD